jgi:protein-histidine pros-kinase
MSSAAQTYEQLTDEVADLRACLDEANETLRAIRIGEVDAVVVQGPRGDQLFTLKGADEAYRVLIEEMNQGAVTLSADGTILYCNRRFAALLKRPLEQIVGLVFGAFVAPSERAAFAALLETGLIGGSAGDITLCAGDASAVPLQLALGPLPAESAAGICLIATDISESLKKETRLRKTMADLVRAEKEAKAARERYTDLYDFAPSGYFTLDRDGTIRQANLTGSELLGVDRSRLVNRRFELFVAEDSRPGFRAFAEKLFASQSRETCEAILLREGKPPFYARIEARISDNGQECRAVVVDITERVGVEERLRQSEGRLAGIIGSAIDGIITVDEQQRVMVLNAAAEKIFGYTASEMLDQPLDRFIPVRFRAAHAGDIPKFEQTHVPRGTMGAPGTIFGVRANGEEFPIEASISQTTASGSKLFTVILRDVTERKRAEQLQLENLWLEERSRQVETASRLKSEFLANMSHELRTPLNGIIGFAEFLVDGKPGTLNAKQKEYLEDILNSGKHLLQLINDVLDLAKVEAGKTELNPEKFWLRKAIEEACAVTKPIRQKKGIRLEVNVAPELGYVTLDQQKFKQILYNLLSNAIKFNPNGGKVEIRVAMHDAHRFKLSVQDDGIGIKKEDLRRLFKEFEQLESDASCHHEGTGLGLALTRKIVELQGGTIGVESEIGQGSLFTVVLPLVLAEANV